MQYLERFLQKYALPEEPGYFLGSDYSYAETVGGLLQQLPCCVVGIVTVFHFGVRSTYEHECMQLLLYTGDDSFCATRHPGATAVSFNRHARHH